MKYQIIDQQTKNVVRGNLTKAEGCAYLSGTVDAWSENYYVNFLTEDSGELIGVSAWDKKTNELYKDYALAVDRDFTDPKELINPDIKGYDYVKNVTSWTAVEHGHQDYLFVIPRGSSDDYLANLVEVAENTRENLANIRSRYSSDEYIVWWGAIEKNPEGGDEIVFHWS